MGSSSWPSDGVSSSQANEAHSSRAAGPSDQFVPQPDEHTSLLAPSPWPVPAAIDAHEAKPSIVFGTQQTAPGPEPVSAVNMAAPGLTVTAFTEQVHYSERAPLVMGIPTSSVEQQMVAMPGMAHGMAPDLNMAMMQPVARPTDSHVQVVRSAGRLDIIIPAKGFTGSLFVWVFTAVWIGFVAFWTFSVLSAGVYFFALFATPFWLVGFFLVRKAVEATFTQERLAISTDRYRLGPENTLLANHLQRDFLHSTVLSKRVIAGHTASLLGATMSEHIMRDNEGHMLRHNCLDILEGGMRHRFGQGLEVGELHWMVYEINAFLQTTRRLNMQAAVSLAPTASYQMSAQMVPMAPTYPAMYPAV